MTKITKAITAATLLAAISGAVQAATITWDGGPDRTGTNWNDSVNWDGDKMPSAYDYAEFTYPAGTAEQKYMLGAPQEVGMITLPSYGNQPTVTIGNTDDVALGNTLTINYGVFRNDNIGNWQYLGAPVAIPGNTSWEIRPGYNGGLGVLSGITGGGKIDKWGSGILSLKGTNTYEFSGALRVNLGTVEFDMNRAGTFRTNIWNSASPVIMSGGLVKFITLKPDVYTSEARVQQLEDLRLESGTSRFQPDCHWRGTRMLAELIGISREAGATLTLSQPVGNTAINALNGYYSPIQNDASGIMKPYLVVANPDSSVATDWAMNNGVNIVAYNGYTVPNGDTPAITNSPLANYMFNNTSTGTIGVSDQITTINTIKYADTAARTIDVGGGNTLQFGTIGGVLTASGSGALTVTNGTITAGGAADTAGEIIFHNATAINSFSTIADNGAGAVALTKSGGGSLTLNTRPSHTGGTYVNAGSLILPAATPNPLVTTSKMQVVGGLLDLGGNVQTNAGAFVMRGGTVQNGTIVRPSGTLELQGGTVKSVLSGDFDLVKTEAGALFLDAVNNYNGNTYIREGSVSVTGTTRGDIHIGSPEGGPRASFYAAQGVGNSVQDEKNVYVYGNGSFTIGNYDSFGNLYITNGGYASTSGGYAYMNGSIYMHGGKLAGTIYKGNNSLVKTFPSDMTAYFAIHKNFANWTNQTFDVANGSVPIDLVSSGNWFTSKLTLKIFKIGDGTMQITATGSTIEFGSFDVNAGTVLVDNLSGSASGKTPFAVAAGATLGGTGFIGGVAGYTAANVSASGADGNNAIITPGTIDPLTGDHIIGTLTVGSANQANNVTFGNYSTLKIRFDEEGNCDKLAVNGVLSLDSASDTLELDIADYDALKPGTYTLATFSSLATPGSRFNNVIKPQGGTLEYTADSIEYTVHPKGIVIMVR